MPRRVFTTEVGHAVVYLKAEAVDVDAPDVYHMDKRRFLFVVSQLAAIMMVLGGP